MKNVLSLLICVIMLGLPMSGCYTMNHTVGMGGADGNEVASDRQWYILWGLVPITNVDGGQLAKSKGLTTNYTVQTQMSFLDCILNFITGIVSVSGQTVKVFAPAGVSAGSPAAPSGNSLALANQALANKDYNGALQNYQAAANANPNSSAAYQGMGTCYYYMGQKAQALSAYQKALALSPGNTQLSAFVQALSH